MRPPICHHTTGKMQSKHSRFIPGTLFRVVCRDCGKAAPAWYSSMDHAWFIWKKFARTDYIPPRP